MSAASVIDSSVVVRSKKVAIMKPLFRNRTEAGRLLAAELKKYGEQHNVVVLGLARGGVPVAHEVATALHAPLDVLVVRKLGVPCQEELAMGAIAPGGVCVLDEDVIDMLDIGGDAIGSVRLHEERELEKREEMYRGIAPAIDVQGKTVIVVDDGIATGATMRAAVVYVRQENAHRVVIASPVIALEALHILKRISDEVIAIEVPPDLRNVARWYEDFSPTTDDDVRRILEQAETPSVPSIS